MTVLITGARGFIGRHLAAALAADGVSVAGVGRGAWDTAAARSSGLAAWREGPVDAAGLDALAAATGGFDTVYHLAGGASVGRSLVDPSGDFADTVATTARLADWLCRHAPSARLVLVSSAAVYGAAASGPIAESAPVAPLSPYGAHKAMAETLVASRGAAFGLASSIVRLFSVYGPELAKQLLWDVCGRCVAGPAVAVGGTGREQRDWIHVADAVALIRRAATFAAPAAPVINGGTGVATSVAAAVDLVCAAWGEGRHAVFDGIDRPGNPPSLVADVTRAAAIGFAPATDVRRGIAGYVDWFRRR